jgi:flagellar hook-length control protein FliK
MATTMNLAAATAGSPTRPTASLLPITTGSAGSCDERDGSNPDCSFANSLAQAKQAQQGSESRAQAPQESASSRGKQIASSDNSAHTEQGGKPASGPSSADEASATEAADADTQARDSRSTGRRSTTDDAPMPDLSAWLPGWTPPPAAAPGTVAGDAGTGPADPDPRGIPALSIPQIASAGTAGTGNDEVPLADSGSAATTTVERFNLHRAAMHAHPTWESAAARETDDSRPDPRSEPPGAVVAFEGSDKAQVASTPTDIRLPDALTSSQPEAQATISSPALPPALDPSPASQPAPFEARLSAHISSPEFAPALGVQLSMLAREGVHEARLHLHPAEMGPISVQIALQGTQAQVDFVAGMAATRDALQAAMPQLAAALRDSGLNLAGGNVFEQARDPQRGREEAPRENRASAGEPGANRLDTAPMGATPSVRSADKNMRLRGVIDLFA